MFVLASRLLASLAATYYFYNSPDDVAVMAADFQPIVLSMKYQLRSIV